MAPEEGGARKSRRERREVDRRIELWRKRNIWLKTDKTHSFMENMACQCHAYMCVIFFPEIFFKHILKNI